VAAVVAGFAVAIVSNLLSLAFEPDTNEIIQSNLETVTGDRTPWIMAPLIGLTAGIGEELLFRGVLQPRYGIVLSSLLFTALHSQYGLSFVLAGLFGLSIVLGLVAKHFGTTHAIVAHAIYNMVAVAASSLS
jgi:membrane protease YdiL (CAAX protease family)